MGNLFVIDGTCSIWKDELRHYVDGHPTSSALVMKRSTRKARAGENLDRTDLSLISAAEKNRSGDALRWYQYDDAWYGYAFAEIESQLKRVENVFLVVRNLDCIRELRLRYSAVNVVSVFVYTDMSTVASHFASDTGRMASAKKAAHDYMYHPGEYDHVLLDGSPDANFEHQVEILASRQAGLKLPAKRAINVFAARRTRMLCAWVFPPIVMALGVWALQSFTEYRPFSRYQWIAFWELCALLAIGLWLLVWIGFFSEKSERFAHDRSGEREDI